MRTCQPALCTVMMILGLLCGSLSVAQDTSADNQNEAIVSGMFDWLEQLSAQLEQLTTQTEQGSEITVRLDQLDARLDVLEQQIATLQQSVSALPDNTLQTILNYQEEAQAEQEQPQQEQVVTTQGGDDASVGSVDAPLVLVEFSDLNCPFCGRFHAQTYPQLHEDYIATGKLRYIYRDYVGVGRETTRDAAAAAECAREQLGDDGYLQLITALYQHNGRKNVDAVRLILEDQAVDMEMLEVCITEERYVDEVLDDTQAGLDAGIRGTPGFIIGTMQADGTVEGINVQGAQPYPIFQQYIEALLAQAENP